jgi:hypothetical protein
MIIIEIVLWYLIIGCVFDFICNYLTSSLEKAGLLRERLDNNDRIITILLWPIGLMFFLDGFIRTYFNNKDDDN